MTVKGHVQINLQAPLQVHCEYISLTVEEGGEYILLCLIPNYVQKCRNSSVNLLLFYAESSILSYSNVLTLE